MRLMQYTTRRKLSDFLNADSANSICQDIHVGTGVILYFCSLSKLVYNRSPNKLFAN